MAAYAALVSVMQTLHHIHNHPSSPIYLNKEQVQSLTDIVTFLQEFLQGYNSPVADSEEPDPLEMSIADAAFAAEDLIESNIVDRILPQRQRNKTRFFSCFWSSKNDGQNINTMDLYEGLKKVIEDMNLIKKQVMEMVAEKAEVQDQLQRQVSVSASTSHTNPSRGSSLTRINSTLVGFDDIRLEIMDKLTDGHLDRQVIPIVGMGGMGKTTLARNIYVHPFIKEHFDICSWTTISQSYNTKEILCQLLSQVSKERSEQLCKMREDEVGLALYKHLYGRRFLIVLDDMWNIDAWEKMQHYFPDTSNSSRIMVTTRLSNLGSQLDKNYSLEMKFLDAVSSWGIFSEIVLKGGSCPLDLEKLGKKIVESCRGLPLSIVVVGGLVEKMERTKKCWESIRKNLNSLVNSENDEHCLKILKMSYNHLPVHLKPCFLYMGVFEEDRAIRVSTVIKLWVSEGFLKPIRDQSLETTAQGYIKELVDRNLIQAHGLGSIRSLKYCKIHDLLRDLCLRESHKERFYHVVGQHNPRGTSNERCIVIPRGSSKKKVFNAIKYAPCARSCISYNEKVPLLANLLLLRTLQACEKYRDQRHWYSLEKMSRIVNLRYLAIEDDRCSEFPSSIYVLWSLQTLIVSHPRETDPLVDIWKMPQLRHVSFDKLRLHLPDPPRYNIIIMENLQTLTTVWNFKCDVEAIRRIPNIKKLGLLYGEDEGTESHDVDYCLHNIKYLHKLESLNFQYYLRGFAFLNILESLDFQYYSQNIDYLGNISFPISLKKLSLGIAVIYDMEDVLVKIGSLPLLQKLILDGVSFRTWEVARDQFPCLKFLSVKRNYEFENWTTESSPFPCLERLNLFALENLKEIPTEIGEIPTLVSIVLENCSESAVKSMRMIVEEQEELQGEDQLPFKVEVFLWKENDELRSLVSHNFQVTKGVYMNLKRVF